MQGVEGQPAARQWFGWSVALAALVQLALYAAATGPGLAGTSDSVIYLHAAGTLRTAGHLLNPDGTAYRYWPPLYPTLLAVGGTAGAARLLHGLCLLGSLLGWSWLGRRLLPVGWALVLPCALALSTPWLVVSKFVWGETVFLALLAGYLVALYQWLRLKRGSWAVAATGLAALLPLARTAGFFVLLGVALALLVLARPSALKHRMTVLGHLVAAAVLGAAWHVFALLLAAPSVYRLNRGWPQFFSSAADYGFVLARWLVPVPAVWRPGFPVLWSLTLAALLLVLWPRSRFKQVQGPTDAAEMTASEVFPKVLWAVIVVFVLLLLVSTTFTRSASGLYDAERYASALVGPVLLLALRRAAGATVTRRWLRLAAMGVVALWLAYNGARMVSNTLALRRLPLIAWPVNFVSGQPAKP